MNIAGFSRFFWIQIGDWDRLLLSSNSGSVLLLGSSSKARERESACRLDGAGEELQKRP